MSSLVAAWLWRLIGRPLAILTAASGLPARRARAVVESGVAIGLLFSNVDLPDLQGDELARRARRMRPEHPTVFVTGRSEVAGFENAPWRALLKKPYAFDALERPVAAVTANGVAEG